MTAVSMAQSDVPPGGLDAEGADALRMLLKEAEEEAEKHRAESARARGRLQVETAAMTESNARLTKVTAHDGV